MTTRFAIGRGINWSARHAIYASAEVGHEDVNIDSYWLLIKRIPCIRTFDMIARGVLLKHLRANDVDMASVWRTIIREPCSIRVSKQAIRGRGCLGFIQMASRESGGSKWNNNCNTSASQQRRDYFPVFEE